MKYEKYFIHSSFVLLFSLLFAIIFFINQNYYIHSKHMLKDSIKKELQICSYKIKCKNVKVDFIPKKDNTAPLFKLLEDKNSIYMLFDIPKINKYYLKLSLPKEEYYKKLKKIEEKIFKKFLIEILLIIIVALVFSYLLLLPLKKAYKLNETFIKDLIHDINTPLTALKLNIYLLKKECKSNKIEKIEESIQRILKYQENLKNFLHQNPNQKEKINLKEIIEEKLKFYSSLYPYVEYKLSIPDLTLEINKNALSSILENIISNAFKYNKKNGTVKVYFDSSKLIIEDSGIGIENPNRVFERFYKEQERGTGIGMNIVKKLSNELNIPIKIESKKGVGTKVIIDLKKYVNKR